MRACALIALLLAGCARTATPTAQTTDDAAPSEPNGAAILDRCAREEAQGAVVWSCGDAFLAMDASIDEPPTAEAIDANLARFVEPFSEHLISRDDAPWTAGGASHRAVRVRVDLPDEGRFVATMVVVAKADRARVVSCSARLRDEARCDLVLGYLVGRAASEP